MSYIPIHPAEQGRLERLIEHVHSLGPRPVLEVLLALTARVGGRGALIEILEEFQRISPRQVKAARGNRFAPRVLHLLPREARQ